jgi:hypothetical protein
MSEQKLLEEFYELGALKILRISCVPEDATEETPPRHIIMRMTEDKEPAFLWARKVHRTQDSKHVVLELTWPTPMRQRQQIVMVPPGVYLVLTQR